ncbi:MarR family winged helix-turn-helix transcriptional regulator [Neptuniibacter sp. PT8_73]|uniref:MarR family winged helix-turn-helix transcriptional regulator n=1 Tax=unclassified Neptuniibacter TaxID=2630693 RepID=UPI0039F6D2A8
MNLLSVQTLLERITSLLRSENRLALHELGLQPVQLDALLYLSLCNRFSDTLKAVTDYLGLTKGTVSQSLKVLENKGLIEKSPDPNDKRVTHLKVTDEGQKTLDLLLPSTALTQSLSNLGEAEETELADLLCRLLVLLQKQNNYRSFGQCKTCRHNQKREDGYFCGLTQELLSEKEITLICLEHEENQT